MEERERDGRLARRPLKPAETRCAFLLLAEFAAAAFNGSVVRTLVCWESRLQPDACGIIRASIMAGEELAESSLAEREKKRERV